MAVKFWINSPNHKWRQKQNPHQLQNHNSTPALGANMELLHKQEEFREKYTEHTEKCRKKKEINFYVNDQKVFTDKSKLRFHSPLNLQVLAFPLAAWSCCVIKQNVCIRITACFEMLKDWIVFYPFYHRVKNSSLFLKFIRCWCETGFLTVTKILIWGFSSLPAFP